MKHGLGYKRGVNRFNYGGLTAAALAMALLAACARADNAEFKAGEGEPGESLPSVIRDGLATDEALLACGLGATALKVQRADLNGDGQREWLISSNAACLKQPGGGRWWLLRGLDDAALKAGDGAPLLLQTQAARLQLLSGKHQGFADLRADDAPLQFDGRHYANAQAAAPAQAAAGSSLLIDLRVTAPPAEPRLDAALRKQVLEFADLGQQATINSMLAGHFSSAATKDETVYLVQPGGPRAADPQQARSSLLFVSGGQLTGRIDKLAGAFIAGAADVDGDGVQELLLREDSYQMGQSISTLHLVSLRGFELKPVEDFKRAAENGCEGPPAGRERIASVIRYSAGPKFEVQRYRGSCDASPQFAPLKASD